MNEAPSIAACPVGSVELEDPFDPLVTTDSAQHRAIFRRAGLPECPPDLQDPPHLLRQILGEERREVVLAQCLHADALLRKPPLELGEAVRVVEARELPGLLLQLLPPLLVERDNLLDHRDVNPHAVVVHALIEAPESLLALCEREELLPDRHLRDDVLPVIFDVEFPLLRIVLR